MELKVGFRIEELDKVFEELDSLESDNSSVVMYESNKEKATIEDDFLFYTGSRSSLYRKIHKLESHDLLSPTLEEENIPDLPYGVTD